jgi:hypothetical protein
MLLFTLIIIYYYLTEYYLKVNIITINIPFIYIITLFILLLFIIGVLSIYFKIKNLLIAYTRKVASAVLDRLNVNSKLLRTLITFGLIFTFIFILKSLIAFILPVLLPTIRDSISRWVNISAVVAWINSVADLISMELDNVKMKKVSGLNNQLSVNDKVINKPHHLSSRAPSPESIQSTDSVVSDSSTPPYTVQGRQLYNDQAKSNIFRTNLSNVSKLYDRTPGREDLWAKLHNPYLFFFFKLPSFFLQDNQLVTMVNHINEQQITKLIHLQFMHNELLTQPIQFVPEYVRHVEEALIDLEDFKIRSSQDLHAKIMERRNG